MCVRVCVTHSTHGRCSYANAGTVEYLYTPDTRAFSFLELNPRLQASAARAPCDVV